MPISVVIPVGSKREKNLSLVLHALTFQIYKDFEVVVVSERDHLEDVVKGYDYDITYCYKRPERPNLGATARNLGAELAKHDYLLFIDSDVVLNRYAIHYYMQDFTDFPSRAIAGPYKWMPPMRVTKDDLSNRWAEFTSGDLPKIDKDTNHNIGDDPRTDDHWESQDNLYCSYQKCLGLLSGNLAIKKDVFFKVGGFWEEITNGIDGAFGLAMCKSGQVFSFDKRTVGYHLYHDRENWFSQDVVKESRRKIEERFFSKDDNSWLAQRKTWE